MGLRDPRSLVLIGSLALACDRGASTDADPKPTVEREAPRADPQKQPQTDPQTDPVDINHETTAKQIVAWIDAGEHAKVRELFDDAMNKAIPNDDTLAAMWTAIEAQFGQYRQQLGTTVEQKDPYTIALVTCAFEKSPMDVRVVFDAGDRLAGLQVTPSQSVEAYGERPQTPKPPFPYTEEEVRYPNATGGIEIGGTLTLPSGAGPHPAVLLITGSGPQDRDETLFGHKPFAVIADRLTRDGIAVLRVDDRGVGKTTGDPATATIEDHATDVEAGLAFLAARSDIDGKRIGLIGHSEGGVIAPMVAARSSQVAFIVSLAGPGVSGAALNPMQVRALLEAGGGAKEVIDEIVAGQTELMALLVADAPEEQLAEAVKKLALVAVKLQPGAKPDDLDAAKAVAREMVPLLSPWFRSWAKTDPAVHLAKLEIPILVMIGDKDLQVPADPNLAAIDAALAGKANVRTEKLPGLNHLFQTAKIGTMEEYVTLSETFAPAALDMLAQWVVETASKESP
ncbi:MAG TPA: alpha/beta fold hydrolase [Enhygromyxa sp.]|nr:alpha/beta fold hydrolase [Enhygromyxa sp.]